MIAIANLSLDPAFNLAAEEFLLKEKSEEVFMFWRNENTIVLGKHQNALAEINRPVIKQNNIKVHRRLTGGGTVFHDLGNINFTFIKNAERKDRSINFKKYMTPIVDVVQFLGVPLEFNHRNDLVIEGKKVSGNAEHVYHKNSRVIHHGTLLFDSKLNELSAALKVTERYTDKAVKSVRSPVANIRPYLANDMDVLTFYQAVFDAFCEGNNCTIYSFTTEEIAKIESIAAEKYRTWEWNFGYSPKYRLNQSIQLNSGDVTVDFLVVNGCFESFEMKSSVISKAVITLFQKQIIGVKHKENDLFSLAKECGLTEYLSENQLLELLF